MATETNPNTFATVEQGGGNTPPIAIQDGVDFPHTGLIKALQQGMQGNYAIKGAANEFDITQQSSDPVLSVTAGNIYQDNLLTPVTTNLTFNASDFNKEANNYHLLVAEKIGSGARLAIRKFASPTVDKVPPINQGDAVIALIKYTGSDASNGLGVMQVQYLTTSKIQNQLSITQGSSGDTVYTEAARLVGGTNTVDFVTQGNRNLAITPDGTGQLSLDGLNWPTSDGSADQVLKTDGAGGLFFSTLSSNSITDADGDTKIQVEESSDEDKIRFDTANNERMIIDNVGNVGIGTSTPAFALDIANGGLRTNANIVSQTDISAANGTISGNILSATANISNSGNRTRSMVLFGDANQGGNAGGGGTTDVFASPDLNNVRILNSLINCAKEEYYVGFDSSGPAGNQSHTTGGQAVPDTQALPQNTGVPPNDPAYNPNGDFYKMMAANLDNQNNYPLPPFNYTYAAEEVFGGNALFACLVAPPFATDKEIVVHNITGFALYLVVVNPEAFDGENPLAWLQRGMVNGGRSPSNFQFGQTVNSNERVVNLSKVLMNSTAYPATLFGNERDAILLKPRESVRLRAKKYGVGDGGGNDPLNDLLLEQGGYSDHQTNGINGFHGQWFITGSSSGMGLAHTANLAGASRHIPVHMSGTTFICFGNNNIVLPNSPPIGTQYSFIILAQTTNFTTVQGDLNGGLPTAQELSMFTSFSGGNPDGIIDNGSPVILANGQPYSVTSGARTFIYAGNVWHVIG